MKMVCRQIVLLAFLFCISGKVVSQISFTIDSLNVSRVIWLCQNDVVIEDFAYGPHFNILFSVKNNGRDTIRLHFEDISIYVVEDSKRNNWQKEIYKKDYGCDTTINIPPNSSNYFWGYVDWNLTGEITTGLNYRLVNFLPNIEKILKETKIIIKTPDFDSISVPYRNCYTEKPFFVDGTGNESIYNANN